MQFHTLNPMKAKRLTAGKYADGQGLWLVKSSQRRGKWIFRFTLHGRRREMGLGGWPQVGLAEAREQAAEARREVRFGTDPINKRQEERGKAAPLSLKDAIHSCFKARKAELKEDGKAGGWLSPLTTHIIPKYGNLPITSLDQHQLVQMLSSIWHQKADTARKCLNRLSLTLKHAAALGLPVDLQAPMKARALLGKQRHESTHIPSMPYQEVPAFYATLVKKGGQSATALRLLILTACRTGEVRLARFSEIDLEKKVWTIPKERTKTGKEHLVPLTAAMLAIIDGQRQLTDSDLLFPSNRNTPLSDMAMSMLMRKAGLTYRPHGFRASFRTWAEECTDFLREVKEACLGHAVDGKVEGAYQRSDRLEKRREVLERWEKHLLVKKTL